MWLLVFGLNIQMSFSNEILPILVASMQRLGRGLGAERMGGVGGVTCLVGSGTRGSIGKLIVGFIVMIGAMLAAASGLSIRMLLD
jgi:hypothetical protein